MSIDDAAGGGAPRPSETPTASDQAATDGHWLDELTPRQIVAELDRYIIGQDAAKKAVAIALRNRWRRQRVDEDLRDEIMPNNLILIGPTGVGKTEIARRLARLAGAPFVKVEASKFTEVGYVGRDVESMIRDLVDTAVNLVRAEREDEVQDDAERSAEERLLDLLLPPVSQEAVGKVATARRPAPGAGGAAGGPAAGRPSGGSAGGGTGGGTEAGAGTGSGSSTGGGDEEGEEPSVFVAGPGGVQRADEASSRGGAGEGGPGEAGPDASGPRGSEPTDELSLEERRKRTREKLRKLLRDGKLDDREVEIEVQQQTNLDSMMVPMGVEGMDHNFTDMLQDLLPKRTKRRTVKVPEARRILVQEELDRLVDMDEVVNEALDRTEDSGIIFLDEIDKVSGERGGAGPDVSREGVQRDLLPVVEGSNVQTKYGLVRTDHILFIAAGAFHVAKPSDLIPELQGRFPIRVELQNLDEADFVRILKEPRNALLHQYRALIETEGASVEFTDEGVAEIARIAATLNQRMENIGARRLQTVMTTLLEGVLFDLPDVGDRTTRIDAEYVGRHLSSIVDDEDLRRYIL